MTFIDFLPQNVTYVRITIINCGWLLKIFQISSKIKICYKNIFQICFELFENIENDKYLYVAQVHYTVVPCAKGELYASPYGRHTVKTFLSLPRF